MTDHRAVQSDLVENVTEEAPGTSTSMQIEYPSQFVKNSGMVIEWWGRAVPIRGF